MLLFWLNTPHPFDAAPFQFSVSVSGLCDLPSPSDQIPDFPCPWKSMDLNSEKGFSNREQHSWDIRTRSNFRDYLIDLFFFLLQEETDSAI